MGTGSDYILAKIVHDGNEMCGSGYYRNGMQDEEQSVTTFCEIVFVATSTTLEFSVFIGGTASLISANNFTRSTIEELNNTIETTDFA